MKKVFVFLLLTLALPSLKAFAADSIDLLWKGEVYAPPFYQGRTLWTNESRVTVTAIPNISGFNTKSLYYRWTKDGTVLGELSGIGKLSLTFTDTVLSLPIDIKVDARDGEDGKVLATSIITLTPTRPRIMVIEDSPIYGLMFNKAVGDGVSLTEREISFSMIPLFARVTKKLAPALTYTWTTNTGDQRSGSRVTYRSPEGESGSAKVTASVVNSGVLSTPADKSFLIQFGNKNGL